MIKLQELRKKRNLKQSELAELLHVKQNTISNWENARTEINNTDAIKLADFFNVSVDYLLGRTETNNDYAVKNEINLGELGMNKIKELRKAKNMTQNQLCKILKIAQPTLSGYENETSEPDFATFQKIADYFNVSVDYLLGRTETNNDYAVKNEIDLGELEMYPIPLLGRVVAGVPIESQENLEGYVYINYKPKDEYFALKVFGDSMINAGIPDGAILIVHKQTYASNGNIVVAFLNGEQTVKYLKLLEEDMFLIPANNNYLPIPIRKTDDFMILGKVVEVRVQL